MVNVYSMSLTFTKLEGVTTMALSITGEAVCIYKIMCELAADAYMQKERECEGGDTCIFKYKVAHHQAPVSVESTLM
jgi:hypothetical protein